MLSSVQRKCISLFTRWLDYYGKVFNKVVIAVPLQYTTQECSGCGYLVKKTLSARTHQCPQCGLVMERPTACWHYQDVNAAMNILCWGLELLGITWNSTLG